MIPLTLAHEVRLTLLDYLTTTFNLADAALEEALQRFMEDPEQGMFQGPFVHLRLPFRKSSAADDTSPPLTIAPPFVPYVHQQQAFQRLAGGGGRTPRPTLITTGTGSGKTECFLYPILDHCHRHQEQPGIKAIILYPMNALATDQAQRLAQAIHDDERLRGRVRAGIYIGGAAETPQSTMGESWIIDDRRALRENPPDILLTNYKMLDFLLLRPEDKPLWANNGPDTLRYLVLDELHTYDGAQGSDVACLIRRLRARLGAPERAICPVGTSATVVGLGEDTATALTDFAEQIFDTPFERASVIGEARLSLGEFLTEEADTFELPSSASALDPLPGEDDEAYAARQSAIWFGAPLEPEALGVRMKRHAFLRILLTAAADEVVSLEALRRRLARADESFGAVAQEDQARLLRSFLALIAHARVADGNRTVPLLTLQVQLWVRELSRLMRAVTAGPRFFWRDDQPLDRFPRGLPAYVCRECGHSGWLSTMQQGDERLTDDLARIYGSYFDKSKNTAYVYPGEDPEQLFQWRLCPETLRLTDQEVLDGVETIPVALAGETSTPKGPGQPRDLQRCPRCATDNGLSIMGRQAASLLSVAIGHLFTTPQNSEKKLLAFTDSVQDASHRAAFFGQRTYRFSLRTAFQRLLETEPAGEIPLDQFTDRLLVYWLEQWRARLPADSQPEAYQRLVATFMPADLHEMNPYRRYLDGRAGPIPDYLESCLRKRLSWEVVMEYGFNARLGRSLEQVGSSTAYLDPEPLADVVDRIHLRLREEIGQLQQIDRATVRHFVTGLLERTRTRGGVVHPLLNKYMYEQGSWYMLTKKMTPLLSPFHKNSPRFPRFLSDNAGNPVFDSYLTAGGQPTWYVDWARRALVPALGTAEINDIYYQVMLELVNAQFLDVESKGNQHSYGLRPEKLRVSRHTGAVVCDTCGLRQTVTVETAAQWAEERCLSYRCAGRFQIPSDGDGRTRDRYYRRLYEGGEVERIFSAEHTGLLERAVREQIENHFRRQDRADAPNLLTATPTLEMGIDIGDLSAVIACSVPPTTANYLQRIGRAGRKSGNSFVLALANARPHDLYYFQQPREMIAGAIVPPGCFLDAPNMLVRQFLAFCMDSWTAADPRARQLPRNVQEMLARRNRGGFPTPFLEYYAAEQQTLGERFLALFGPVVSDENRHRLRDYAAGDALPAAINDALEAVVEERAEIRKDIRRLQTEIDRVEANKAQYDDPDELLEELNQEKKMLIAGIKQLEEKYILNFFTDAGLLPNYAFPESGVQLRAVITGVEPEAEGGRRYIVREYVRPAPVAIRELAPFNTFYAEAHKVHIDTIDLRGSDDVVERWQFCNRCSHMSPLSATHYSASCPRCGSELWSDAGQEHDMLRLRAVAARADRQQSLVGDEGDDRERQRYDTGRYFHIDPEQTLSAHLIPALPFGLEALREVTLREINFGLAEAFSKKVSIADEEQPETGFQVCTGCGVVHNPLLRADDRNQPQHARNCPILRKKQQGHAEARHDLYLYRQMESEALRLLLPVSTALVREKLATFQACLDLGLRLWFNGDPAHLQILPHTEVAPDGTRRRFLVIYDAVPGGTSYLRDLARPDAFRDMLEQTMAVLTSCECRGDPEKKACYHCLYSYHSQYEKDAIDRALGVTMVREILDRWEELQEVATLSEADMVSLLESELEQRFIDAVAAAAHQRDGWQWRTVLHRGKEAYELTIGPRRWRIEPQVHLGHDEGVAIPSKPDFLLRPLGQGGIRPVALFTDGFAYHAQPQHSRSRIGDDVAKRRALRDSGSYVAWSVTWDDVEEFAEKDAFSLELLPANKRMALVGELQKRGVPLPADLVHQNSVAQLLHYLVRPELDPWRAFGGLLATMVVIPPRKPINETVAEEKARALRTAVERPSLSLSGSEPEGSHHYAALESTQMQLLVHVPNKALQTQDLAQMSVTLRLHDTQTARNAQGFVDEWRACWLWWNLLQFLPDFAPVSTEYIRDLILPEVDEELLAHDRLAVPAPLPADSAWDEAIEFALPDYLPLVERLRDAGVPAPVSGYELTDGNGAVAGLTELGWAEARVAFLLPEQARERPAFEAAGWQVYTLDDEDALLAALEK